MTYRSTPIDRAWECIFGASKERRVLEAFRTLFPDNDDFIINRRFSEIHKSILGLSFRDLEEELPLYRDSIDAVDATGNTPLMWATRRGDIRAVKLLVRFNANLNVQSTSGETALYWAACLPGPTCLEYLLKAGADPFLINKYNESVLHVAAQYQKQDEAIVRLVRRGLDTDARDASGSTPLVKCRYLNNRITASALLDLGADINALDNDGDSPLHEIVQAHADDLTQLLLRRGATYTTFNSLGDSILHQAALAGGLRTLEILRDAKLRGIDPDALNRQGKTALQVAQERLELPERFLESLRTLVAEIRARNPLPEDSNGQTTGGLNHRISETHVTVSINEKVSNAPAFHSRSNWWWWHSDSIVPVWAYLLVSWLFGLMCAGLFARLASGDMDFRLTRNNPDL